MTDRPLRRFYQLAEPADADGGHTVLLDGRRLRTPKGALLLLPTAALAHAIATEWAAQKQIISPSLMPLTQLAFIAVDWTSAARTTRIDYVASFVGTDLCCHRAAAPAALATRQTEMWDPLLQWAESALDLQLSVVEGVIAAPVAAGNEARVRELASVLDDFRLTGLAQTAGLAGSAVIGFALVQGRIDAEQAFHAAMLDELWNMEHWGEDAEAAARLDGQRAEFENVARFVTALKVQP